MNVSVSMKYGFKKYVLFILFVDYHKFEQTTSQHQIYIIFKAICVP